MITYHVNEHLEFAEFREFLTRCDLGSQYPLERFETRVHALLKNRSVAVSARDEEGRLAGIALGLTDFAYFLFVTDLGVARDFQHLGIGRELLSRLHVAAGGPEDITVVSVANDAAIGFYEKCGYENEPFLFWKSCAAWTRHTVS